MVRELTFFCFLVASGNGLLVPGPTCSLKRAYWLGKGTVSLSPVPVMRNKWNFPGEDCAWALQFLLADMF